MISRGFAPRADHPGQCLTRVESDNSVIDEAGGVTRFTLSRSTIQTPHAPVIQT
jgi:hypothetical protein